MLEVYDALKIAVTEVRIKYGMPDRYKLRARGAEKEKEWVFEFISLPEKPGHDFMVFVSDEGKTRLRPGR